MNLNFEQIPLFWESFRGYQAYYPWLTLTLMFADRVLYARKGEDVTSQAVTLGGDKITVDDAIVSSNSDHLVCLINPLADSEEGLLGRA